MSSFQADNLAVVLGLKTSTDPARNLPLGQEILRQGRLMFELHTIRQHHPSQYDQDIVWSQFCALYLPATIDRLLDLPVTTDAQHPAQVQDFVAYNPWHEMLVQVQHIPYLSKYLRSRSPIAAPGKRLPGVLAERLAQVSAQWDAKMIAVPRRDDEREYYIAAAGSAIQLICTLCTHFINEADRDKVIPKQTQQALLPILAIWGRRYNGEFLGDVSRRLLAYISRAPSWEQAFNSVRSSTKNWGVCGLPVCNVRKDLRVCARCQTVRYCDPSHQRKDWSGPNGSNHKSFCFKSEY
ncbi:hypothetical protein C8R46DRAFT_280471 [Mycena filopes]|nr:hypothetical protein C8R46DRAFT_280471 [Mycena filopes]